MRSNTESHRLDGDEALTADNYHEVTHISLGNKKLTDVEAEVTLGC